MTRCLRLAPVLILLTAAAGCDDSTAAPVDGGAPGDAGADRPRDDAGPSVDDAGPGFDDAGPGTTRRAPTGLGVNAGFYDRVLSGGGRVFREGVRTSSASEADAPFDPAFLALLEPFDAIRFNQFHLLDYSREVEWADRASPDVDLPITQQGRDIAVPYEWEIAICNAAGVDLWIGVPHMASDDYVRQLAALIRERLRPDLRVYVEYSNEVWNSSYADGAIWDDTPDIEDGQYSWALNRGNERGFARPNSDYYVYASVRVWQTFEAAFGADADRLVRVLAGRLPDLDEYEGDAAPDWNPIAAHVLALQDPALNPEGATPDVYAVNTYFAHGMSAATFSREALLAGVDGLDERLTRARSALTARGYDEVALVAYEGGQHINDDAHVVNREPAMYDAYRRWLELGSRHLPLSMHYSLVTEYLPEESFGLLESIDQPIGEAHKWRAIVDWVRERDAP